MITSEQKTKLKKLFSEIITDGEKKSLEKLGILEAKKLIDVSQEELDRSKENYKKIIDNYFQNKESEFIKFVEKSQQELKESEGKYQKLLDAFSKFATASYRHSQTLIEQFTNFNENLSKNLEAVASKITSSYEKNKPFNAAGVYKDMINQLSTVNESIKNKPIPVWNWPQYAGVSVRNRNFSTVNPLAPGDTFTANTSVNISSVAQIIAANLNRYELFLFNNGTDTVFIGNSGVTTSNGFPLLVNAAATLRTTTAVFGVANSGTQDVRYFEIAT